LSGPDLSAPIPGSNAIGVFEIGVSPIGTIPPFDVWDTIISQYADSSAITSLIVNFAGAFDQTANFDAFYDYIWNVATAQGVGLDIWGRIVGVTRILNIVTAGPSFDFEEAGLSGTPFGESPFYDGGGLTTNFALSDDSFRVLIYAKALANISDGSIKSINQILRSLFPNRGGNAYVADGLDMTLTYTFGFVLTAVELAIIEQSGVLPKSTGVSSTVVQV
jgi:hypothetical protein